MKRWTYLFLYLGDRLMTWILSKSTRMQPAMALAPWRWSFDVENTVNTRAPCGGNPRDALVVVAVTAVVTVEEG